MKNIFSTILVIASFPLFVAGCGGGGGGTTPKTQGSATAYLFGSMSSASKVMSITSKFTVPDGVMVNYSSAPGVTTGIHPLRSGSVIPSGLSMFSKADISTSYNTYNRQLTIGILNNQMKDIKSNMTGNGAEIATLSFKLTTPDVLPTLPTPWVEVYQRTSFTEPLPPETVVKTGIMLNFMTTYQ